ncbi:MAG: hypothetical protein F4X44_04015 [Gammaproteobacteria bacterium]|nr:hypothetical protein [Gammaproteobacteria bacterium]
MNDSTDLKELILARADEDSEFRKRLLADPKQVLKQEFGWVIDEEHVLHVHEESDSISHLVLRPESKYSASEREEARTGASSLEFLKKTMYDPAPPRRPVVFESTNGPAVSRSTESHLEAGRQSIRRGLDFVESTLDENGAWHCIRFNLSDPNIPRHYEKPPFVSALCTLAIEDCEDSKCKTLCTRTKKYLIDKMEYPGFWRYYRHLPKDLDSTALCSLVLGAHPWIFLGRNIPGILANQDEDGRYMTWMLEEGEPDVVSKFRIEADPVVNANLIAHLGDHPETRNAQLWLDHLLREGDVDGSSKWYPDSISIYYAITRAIKRAKPALSNLESVLVERIMSLRNGPGGFGNILHSAQAVSALYNIGQLDRIDAKVLIEHFIGNQQEDGSWPEFLAFGDQTMQWGKVGQIGHGSESVTSAFCIEALNHLVAYLDA